MTPRWTLCQNVPSPEGSSPGTCHTPLSILSLLKALRTDPSVTLRTPTCHDDELCNRLASLRDEEHLHPMVERSESQHRPKSFALLRLVQTVTHPSGTIVRPVLAVQLAACSEAVVSSDGRYGIEDRAL